MCITWATQGLHMDVTWVQYGCHMGIMWLSGLVCCKKIFVDTHMYHIVCMCASHGQLMGVAWMSYGHHVTVIFSPLHWSILRNLCRFVCQLCSHVEGLCTQVIVYFYLYWLIIWSKDFTWMSHGYSFISHGHQVTCVLKYMHWSILGKFFRFVC